MSHEHFDLARRYFDGLATEDETRALEVALRTDAAFRRWFLRYANVDAALGSGRLSAAPIARTQPLTRRAVWLQWRPLAAAAALVLAGLAWWLHDSARSSGVAVEIVAAAPGPFAQGQRFTAERLQIATGRLAFKLDSGVLVEATGPVEIELLSAMRQRVLRGQVTADVGQRGKGFVIETAAATIVDLGTRFGVNATDAGGTDVLVYEGTVEVYEPEGRAGPMIASLGEGEGMSIDAAQAASRITCAFVDPAADNKAHRGRAPARAVITDARDNLASELSRKFYRIVVEGLQPGVQAAHSRGQTWMPVTGSEFPTWLAGADFVGTFGPVARQSGFELTVMLARPATVFVFYDASDPVPAWLSQNYTDTGERLRLTRGSKGPNPPSENIYAVWRSAPQPAGAFTVGQQMSPSKGRIGLSYAIAAKNHE